MVHGKNRIPYRIHRRLTGLAGPDITPSSRLACPLSLKTPNMGNPGSSSFRPTSLPRSVGITPVNALFARSSSVRLTSLLTCVGISPVNAFCARLITSSRVKLPTCVGIPPVNPSFWRDSFTTRLGVPPTVIPSQSEMGVLVPQLSVLLSSKLSCASNSVLQSDTRPGLLFASATAPSVTQGTCVAVAVNSPDQRPSPTLLTART